MKKAIKTSLLILPVVVMALILLKKVNERNTAMVRQTLKHWRMGKAV